MGDKYGIQARVGERFFEEVENIKTERIINKKSKEKPSTRVISDLIVRHTNFAKIKKEIIEIDEEILYGK